MQLAATPSHTSKPSVYTNRFRFVDPGHPAMAVILGIAARWAPEDLHTPAPPPPPVIQGPIESLKPMDIIQMEVRLPPMPAVLVELQEIIQRRHSSATMISEVISKDPGLTAWILRLINSPYYGFSTKIATVSRAVALIGTNQLQTLALGGALNSLAVLVPKGLLDMKRFWRHSMAVALAAREIWKLTGRNEIEKLFVSGLLHDCGKLAMVYAAPKVSALLHECLDSASVPPPAAEKEMLGFDHAKLGGMLMHRWCMPLPLIMSILHHHDAAETSRFPEVAAVHVACTLVTGLGITIEGERTVSPLSEAAWNTLGLAPEKLESIAHLLQEKLDEMYTTMHEAH